MYEKDAATDLTKSHIFCRSYLTFSAPLDILLPLDILIRMSSDGFFLT